MNDPDESRVFESFVNYDFKNDINFQNGWKQISTKISQGEIPTQLYRAKIFYYNKNVAPIHGDHFKEWMKVKEISDQLATISKEVEYSDQLVPRSTDKDVAVQETERKNSVQKVEERGPKYYKIGEDEEKEGGEEEEEEDQQQQHKKQGERLQEEGEKEEVVENKMVRKKDIDSVDNTFEKYETLNLCVREKGKNLENSINVSGNGDQDKNIQQVSDIDKDENSCKDATMMGTSTVVIENIENLRKCFPDKDEKKCSDGVVSTQQISERLNLEDVDSSSREKMGKESSEIFEDEIKLSFGEIVTLIQSGEAIPGLKSIDVKPSNSLPSPSLLPQVRKPWQTD